MAKYLLVFIGSTVYYSHPLFFSGVVSFKSLHDHLIIHVRLRNTAAE